MERKLVKQGRDALTVTLPAKWLRAKKLSAGDPVYMEEENTALRITPRLRAQSKEITLQVRNAEESMIWHQITGAYIEGYDVIVINHSNPTLIQKVPQFFIGLMIERHSATQSTIKSIIAEPEKNIDVLILRMHFMLVELARIVEEYTRKMRTLESVKEQERLLDSTVYYCMRYLNKYYTEERAYRYFLLCAVVEFAGDQISLIAKYIDKDRALAALIVKYITAYSGALAAKDLERAYKDLRAFRNGIPKKTFAQGLTVTLAESLYNNLGYLITTTSKP